jgi:predicted transcriptional regulator YdeE
MTKFFTLESSINIAGIKITTNNIEAFQVIPAFWGRFFSEKISSKICNKISEDIYAVYSDFENFQKQLNLYNIFNAK